MRDIEVTEVRIKLASEDDDKLLGYCSVTLNNAFVIKDLKIIHGAVCGEQPGMTNIPFTLAFKEPLPIPVDRYPLICEKEGLRRCF